MSIASLLPPICDPIDGHLLMDGCYVNNVPGVYLRIIYTVVLINVFKDYWLNVFVCTYLDTILSKMCKCEKAGIIYYF